MRDIDIRRALREQLERDYGDDPATLLVDELGVDEGSFRIDVALVNGAFQGFEIKSPRDTLVRLPAQARAYGRVFDALTLLVTARHLDSALELLPEWWGVIIADHREGKVELAEHRGPTSNPGVDPYAIAQLLWRGEALEVLEEHGLARGRRRKPRRELWATLATELPSDRLGAIVRERLRARRSWRPAPSPS